MPCIFKEAPDMRYDYDKSGPCSTSFESCFALALYRPSTGCVSHASMQLASLYITSGVWSWVSSVHIAGLFK
jgi:hypothetical protein